MKYFGMVTTRSSSAYTPHALRSFFDYTSLEKDDRFYLIDNDGSFNPSTFSHAAVTLIRNSSPIGFAANVNQIMRLASTSGADLIFLNNDLVFTPNWLGPLLVSGPGLVSPVSNFQFAHRTQNFDCKKVMDLADYVGHEKDLDAIAIEHARVHQGLIRQFMVWFFCIRIPFAVYQMIGPLDETFGRGGGEDADDRLRCHLAEIPVCFAAGSFVLHFMGKSTWRGPETAGERAAHLQAFRKVFIAKWGEKLADLAIDETRRVLETDPAWKAAFARRDFRYLVEGMRLRGGSAR